VLNDTLQQMLELPSGLTPRHIMDQLQTAGILHSTPDGPTPSKAMLVLVPHAATPKMRASFKGRGKVPGFVTIHLPEDVTSNRTLKVGNFNLKV